MISLVKTAPNLIKVRPRKLGFSILRESTKLIAALAIVIAGINNRYSNVWGEKSRTAPAPATPKIVRPKLSCNCGLSVPV